MLTGRKSYGRADSLEAAKASCKTEYERWQREADTSLVSVPGHLPDPGPLFFAICERSIFVKLRARVDAPAVPLRVRPDFGSRSSDRSQVASSATMIAASMTSAKKMRSAGRFCACSLRGISLSPNRAFARVAPTRTREDCSLTPRHPTFGFAKVAGNLCSPQGELCLLSSVLRGGRLSWRPRHLSKPI
jgi:hypothetical protein